jgi:NAD(P)-dependent dehydrogenase (short-subunit alcohol dehydrogenase family)
VSVEELFNLQGKVAVVLGGARDLGYDMAEILADAGCNLVVTSRSQESADIAAAKLRSLYDVEIMSAPLDITDHTQVQALATQAIEWHGHVDVLINNAGGGLGLLPTNLFERKPEHMAQLINTNLTGTLFSCQAFGRIMVEQRSGSIINIASIAGMLGRDRRMYQKSGLSEQPIDYAAAKAGVIGLTKDLAGFMSPYGVRVNAISPGGFERGQPQAFIDAYNDSTPMGRMGKDGLDLKGAALFLASPASDYVTGHNLVVDGGFSIWH